MWCLKLGANSSFLLSLERTFLSVFEHFILFYYHYLFWANIQKCLAGTLSHLPVCQTAVQQFCSIYVHVLPPSKREDAWRSPSYLCIIFTSILSIKKVLLAIRILLTTKLNDPQGKGNLVQGAKNATVPSGLFWPPTRFPGYDRSGRKKCACTSVLNSKV